MKMVEVPFDQLTWCSWETPKVPAVPSYKGYEMLRGTERVGYMLTDHFTWDDQSRSVKRFLAELNERVPVVR